LTVLVGILFGVSTVFHAARFDLDGALKDGGRGSASRAKTRVRNALVVAQITLALVLLVCAGLATQGFRRLAAAYQGFDPASVLRVEIGLAKEAYSDKARIASFFRQLLAEARALPGVASVSLIANPPASNVDNETTFFTIEGRQWSASEAPSAELQIASPGYLETLRVALVQGRAISESDTALAPRVVVISQSMASRFWPAGDALGHRIKLGNADSVEPWMTIAGVVSDVRQNWWNPVARPLLYEPFEQAPSRSMAVLLRTSGDPLSYAPSIRAAIRRLDPDAAVPSLTTLEHEVADSIAIIRILGVLMGIFGGVAVALASVGVYGVLSESVAQRTREIGIRMSLGARTASIGGLILGQALKLGAIGLLIGVPLALLLNRVMASTLFGIVPLNALLVAALALALLLVAFAAAYFPARRAMRLDPIRALRYE